MVTIQTIPQIGLVEWQTFKSRGLMLWGNTDAIDVLMGEPEISFSLYRRVYRETSFWHSLENVRSHYQSATSFRASIADWTYPNQLHGRHSNTPEDLLNMRCVSSSRVIVITRSFKALVYLEKSIWEHYTTLECKFTPYTSTDSV